MMDLGPQPFRQSKDHRGALEVLLFSANMNSLWAECIHGIDKIRVCG
jgi:hypothetical protein